jgi:hypothetical protein
MRVRHLALIAVAILVGCSDRVQLEIDPPPAIEDAPAIDAAPEDDAPAPCSAQQCDWLADYQHRIVSQLGGATEISPGVTLTNRASVAARDAARAYLLAELAALGVSAQRVDYTRAQYTGANVIAMLPATAGTDTVPILVGAHFDGVAAGPGAADNATGVAIVLAAARYLKDVPSRRRPVIFALFDQEELGLIGSRAYVAQLVAAGTALRGAHVFDMLSWDGDGDHTVELWSPSPALETLYRAHGPAAGTPITKVAFASSDHQAFLDRGFPAAGVGEEFVGGDHTPNYHQATDTVANVSFAHLATVSHLALAVLEADVTAP